MELDSGISRLISTDTTSFHNMDKYMKGQKSPLVVLYRSKTLLNSRLGSWHKALPGANSLALTSRTPELSYNCNAKLILVKKSLCLRVQRFIPKGSGIQQPGKRGVFKNPYSKNTNRTSYFGRGNCAPTIWVPIESL